MDKNTVIKDSNLGQRLEKVQHKERRIILFNNKTIPIVGKITIGRDSGNTIVIDNCMVSRKHTLIHKIKNNYFIKDLNSTNGTLINNKKVPTDVYIKINPGDVITIGKMELVIK